MEDFSTLRQGQRDPIREVLSPDGSALVSQFDAKLQCLVGKLSHACKGLGLTISLRKTYIMAQDAEASPPQPPLIIIDAYALGKVYNFIFLRSTVTNSLSPDA